MMKNWKTRKKNTMEESCSSFVRGSKASSAAFLPTNGPNVSIVAQAINFFRIVIESAKELSQLRAVCE